MSKEKLIESAEKFIKEGKYDKAIKEYRTILQGDPADMRAKLKVGDLLAKSRDIQGAIKTYLEVADTYTGDNFFLKAIAVYKSILKISPTMVEINERLGDLYIKVGLNQDAVAQYYIVASNYDSKGMIKEALGIRKKIISADPGNVTGRIRLAELMQAEGKEEDSLREYERIAELLKQRNDRDGLVEIYEKILYFHPADFKMLEELCHIYFEKKDFKKILRKIEGAPAEVKAYLPLFEIWAEAMLEDRQVDASRRKFKDLYEACLQAGDADRAARVYSRVLQEFGDDQEYLDHFQDIQKEKGIQVAPAAPKHRQDYEKTEMIDLSKFDEMNKK